MSVEQRNPHRRHAGIKVAAILFLFSILGAMGQSVAPEVFEDYEDDTIGTFPNLISPVFPTATWYTLSVTEVSGNANPFVTAGKYFRLEKTTSYTTVNTPRMVLNAPGQAETVFFDALWNQLDGGGSTHLDIQFVDSSGFILRRVNGAGVVSSGTANGAYGQTFNADCSVLAGADANADNEGVFANTFNFTFNWTAKHITITNEGDAEGSIIRCPFTNTSAVDIARIDLIDGGTNARQSFIQFDNLRLIDIEEGEAAPPGPEITHPIDATRDYFIDSWGFSQSTGNWLFGIAVVGFVVVGFARFQNSIITLVSILLGVGLAVALGYLELWVLLLLIFLGVALGATLLFGNKGDSAE